MALGKLSVLADYTLLVDYTVLATIDFVLEYKLTWCLDTNKKKYCQLRFH